MFFLASSLLYIYNGYGINQNTINNIKELKITIQIKILRFGKEINQI